jgi:acetoin utilization deacetylase AcuC-like enzyme
VIRRRRSTGRSTRLFSARSDGPSFQYSTSSLRHLENTELADDYSRPWTEGKIKALATAIGVGVVLAFVGEILIEILFDVEKSFVFFGGVGTAAGWYLGGGRQVDKDQKPINGGYDRKLIADRPSRLQSVLEYLQDKSQIYSTSSSSRDPCKIRSYVSRIHDKDYLEMLETRSTEADRPQRLNPVYARTLIDQNSFEAALNAISDWMDSVDAALNGKPKFALVRPPSHHACKSKGMGGCLLNSVAVAALYALDQKGVSSVAILDFDAHHGNGIANCVQDIPKIRYCSIHEEASTYFIKREKNDQDDPRSPASNDRGPLGNIRNVNLPPNTGWENGYRQALMEEALPFLMETKPDILLIAAGFDALDADLTSKLRLQPEDFKKMATILKEKFGTRVAFGLEGGYCWQNGELSRAIFEFVSPWE